MYLFTFDLFPDIIPCESNGNWVRGFCEPITYTLQRFNALNVCRILCFDYPPTYAGEPFAIQQGLPKGNGVIFICYDFANSPTVNSWRSLFRGIQMKICVNCGQPIGTARLKANPDAEICSKCIMELRGKKYDDTFDKIHELDVAEAIKQDLIKRTAKVNRDVDNLATKMEQERKKIRESVREELRLEEEELVGKKQQFEQEKSELLSTVKVLTEELNSCVLNKDLAGLQENQIVMHINPKRYTQKSPLLVGKAFVGKNIYNLAIWANTNDKGRRYWSGYLNDTNGNMDGKSSNRRIWFNKSTDSSTLSGQISFGFVSYNVEFKVYEHPTTHLKYWKGKIWPITRE